MLVAFSVSPSSTGTDGSVHDAVAAADKVLRDSGQPNRTDSKFTTNEGSWDQCMAVIKQACEVVGQYGPRVSLVLKADIRPSHSGEMPAKLERREAAIEQLD